MGLSWGGAGREGRGEGVSHTARGQRSAWGGSGQQGQGEGLTTPSWSLLSAPRAPGKQLHSPTRG